MPTVHIHESRAMTNQALRGLQEIPHAQAESNLLNDLIRVLRIDSIFERLGAGLAEISRWDLNQIFDRRL